MTAFFEAGGNVRLGIFEYDPGVTDPETAATGAGSFNLRDQALIISSNPQRTSSSRSGTSPAASGSCAWSPRT
ncbi:MAG: hypothetical protein R3E53_21215 [Myxococcota bacterium]